MRLRPRCVWGFRAAREIPCWRFRGPGRERRSLRICAIFTPWFLFKLRFDW